MGMAEAQLQYRRFVEYFVKNFQAYKHMPDNKSQSFLYKCLSDEGVLIPASAHRTRVSETLQEGPNQDWIGHVCLAPTVVRLAAEFDLEEILSNVRWFQEELVFRSLRSGHPAQSIPRHSVDQLPDRQVQARRFEYLFDVATLRAVQLEPGALWLAEHLGTCQSMRCLLTEFAQHCGWMPAADEVVALLALLDEAGLLKGRRLSSRALLMRDKPRTFAVELRPQLSVPA